MNRWNIPSWLEAEVVARDTDCVYCRSPFSAQEGPKRSRPSWEHIINDMRIITRENIALCCIGCNASKGAKELNAWLLSPYCRTHGISAKSVAPIVRGALSYTLLARPSAPNHSFKPTPLRGAA